MTSASSSETKKLDLNELLAVAKAQRARADGTATATPDCSPDAVALADHYDLFRRRARGLKDFIGRSISLVMNVRRLMALRFLLTSRRERS